jgi:hypothetical protein
MNNLVVGLVWPGHYNGRKESSNTDWPALIEVHKVDGIRRMEGNVAAGSDRAGFRIQGEPRSATTPKYKNNEAHSLLIGNAVLFGRSFVHSIISSLPAHCRFVANRY